MYEFYFDPDPSGRAGLCFVYQKPNMADTEFQEFWIAKIMMVVYL